jgi:NlpC/P60 family putative phage cell wall peptidase
MKVTGMDVVRTARTWLGTPYHHQGRLKGVGVDCAGLVIGVAQELALSTFDIAGYAIRPVGNSLRRICVAQMQCVEREAIGLGDIVLFAFDAHPGHLGILTESEQIIHAYLPRRQVVEHRLDPVWWSKVVALFRLPGVS